VNFEKYFYVNYLYAVSYSAGRIKKHRCKFTLKQARKSLWERESKRCFFKTEAPEPSSRFPDCNLAVCLKRMKSLVISK